MGWEDNIGKFLSAEGLDNLTEGFIAEEIEVSQIPQITNENLVKLGVKTIGAQMRIRSAAAAWLQHSEEVVCFFLHVIVTAERCS